MVGRLPPLALSIWRPGYPLRTQGTDAVLLSATVVSMVPAAPLLPTTEPDSAAEAHRAVPAVVDVDPDGVVEAVVDDEAPEVVVAPVVDVVDELEEQAPRTAPPSATAATSPIRRACRPPRVRSILTLRASG